MAPEMAAGYIVGVIPSLCVTGLHYWLHKRKTNSPAFRQLQDNLAQVGKLWSDTQSRVLLLTESSEVQEQAAFIKSLKILGFLFMLLSWVGFIFNSIILLSVHKIAVSRLEQKVFSSDLCQKSLPPGTVTELLKEFEA